MITFKGKEYSVAPLIGVGGEISKELPPLSRAIRGVREYLKFRFQVESLSISEGAILREVVNHVRGIWHVQSLAAASGELDPKLVIDPVKEAALLWLSRAYGIPGNFVRDNVGRDGGFTAEEFRTWLERERIAAHLL